MKIHYHCSSNKAVNYANSKESLGLATEFVYIPEQGGNLNLVIGNQHEYILWIRQNDKIRSISVLKIYQNQIFQELNLGEMGEPYTALFDFSIKDNNSVVTGFCEITAE